jgi:hypothetical protein
MFTIQHLKEASKMFKRRIKNSFKSFGGSDETICKNITKACFNGTYFQTSVGHFNIFYTRDFAFCAEALLKQGYQKEVQKTLQYALTCFATHNKITTSISKEDVPFDVFSYAVDSLPLLFHSLYLLEKKEKKAGKELIEIYKPFLEKQIDFFYENVVDKETHLVTTKKQFSSIKDHAKRSSSCYDNCMVALLAKHLTFFKLKHNITKPNYANLLKKYFWKNNAFRDDLFSETITGDANVFPYWTKIITDKIMIKQSIKAIQKNNLDKPFPLKYTQNIPHNFIFPLSLIANNYEGNTLWMHLGLCYLDIVKKVDNKLYKQYKENYKKHIEKHKTFLEIFNNDGTPFKTLFYITDEGMLWACKYNP